MASTKVSDLTLGNYLKIVSKGAVYNNLSEDSPAWDLIMRQKKGPEDGRQLRYNLRSALGAGAVGFVAVNGGAYPTEHQSTLNEGTAEYKDFAATIEVERTLINKAYSNLGKYGAPLAEELRTKTIALSRVLSASLYKDGTGVLGTITGTPSISGGKIVMTLNTTSDARGYIGWFEPGDKVLVYNTAGTVQGIDAGVWDETNGSDYLRVDVIDRDNNQITCAAFDASAGATVAITGVDVAGDTDFIYRFVQATTSDLSSGHGTTDYNTFSEDWVGLGTLSEDDGRVANGITLSGALGGTRRSVGGNPIDASDFQKLMSRLMIAVGQGRYSYPKALMAWTTYDALIESRETDRRFQSIKDNKKGVENMAYVHGKNTIFFTPDEFCPEKRIYICPEGDVLQFYGSDFEFVQPQNGQKFFLKPNSTGHDRTLRAYMEGSGLLLSTHSGGIGTIENFTV